MIAYTTINVDKHRMLTTQMFAKDSLSKNLSHQKYGNRDDKKSNLKKKVVIV